MVSANLSTVLFVLGVALFQSDTCAAFAFTTAPKTYSSHSHLHAKKLSAADILARARKAAGVGDNDEPPPPKLFDDDVYEAIQTSLTLVDKRATGELTREEAIDFIESTNKIILDLNRRVDDPHPNPRPAPGTPVTSATVDSPPPPPPPPP
eukprot:CAMPEP_0182453174 /NCGR_PEP_ID=MMETSP1319-20130603/349_1 /TAXON_ID=172717 /ORGANISM="Bolidomonas pacifica, Strain RCC208" /LENGTH=150 /DNA_ID=CAMNT_0024651071 /DNA_START=80 /DNA_END=529 /DNA_ORIENTATION=+